MMEHLPCEIIQKIALFCIDKKKWDWDSYKKMDVLSPDYITKQSINYIFNLSLCSKYLYIHIWKSKYFWKQMFNEYFNSLAFCINGEDYKSFIKKATTYEGDQCPQCYYFHTGIHTVTCNGIRLQFKKCELCHALT